MVYTTSRTTCYPLWVGNNCWSYEEQSKRWCLAALHFNDRKTFLCTKIREEHHLEFLLLQRDCVHGLFSWASFLRVKLQSLYCPVLLQHSSWLFTVPLINPKQIVLLSNRKFCVVQCHAWTHSIMSKTFSGKLQWCKFLVHSPLFFAKFPSRLWSLVSDSSS